MSRFDSQFAGGPLNQLMRQLGRGVTYLDGALNPVVLTAVVGPERARVDQDLDGRSVRRTRDLVVSTDPASQWGGVAAPAHHDQVDIDGARWAVESVGAQSGGTVSLVLVKADAAERSRPGYRVRRS